MSERICVKKRETLQKYEALPEKSKKKKKYKRRDAERLLYAFVSNIPSQEFLSNGLYLRVQLFSDSLQVSSALFPSCISRLQMVPGILFHHLNRDVLIHFSLKRYADPLIRQSGYYRFIIFFNMIITTIRPLPRHLSE